MKREKATHLSRDLRIFKLQFITDLTHLFALYCKNNSILFCLIFFSKRNKMFKFGAPKRSKNNITTFLLETQKNPRNHEKRYKGTRKPIANAIQL